MIRAKNLTRGIVRAWIPKRKADTHKGDYGHTLVIAGSRGMSGAGILCSLGALRGGSGLVTLALPESQQASAVKWVRPEAMTLSLKETFEGAASPRAVTKLLEFIKARGISSIALGPGLSRSRETILFVKKLLIKLNHVAGDLKGIVLDADGFTSLKRDPQGSTVLEELNLPMIATPHPGEMAGFYGLPASKVQEKRMDFAIEFAKLYKVICVLKGHKTIITNGKETYINSTGNPGMAKGGSGDVLTGLIAALIPQMGGAGNTILLRAAAAGAYIHGLAGDMACRVNTEVAMIAGDIAQEIPRAFKRIIYPKNSTSLKSPLTPTLSPLGRGRK